MTNNQKSILAYVLGAIAYYAIFSFTFFDLAFWEGLGALTAWERAFFLVASLSSWLICSKTAGLFLKIEKRKYSQKELEELYRAYKDSYSKKLTKE